MISAFGKKIWTMSKTNTGVIGVYLNEKSIPIESKRLSHF